MDIDKLVKAIEDLTEEVKRLRSTQPAYIPPYQYFVPVNPCPAPYQYFVPVNPCPAPYNPLIICGNAVGDLAYTSSSPNTHG